MTKENIYRERWRRETVCRKNDLDRRTEINPAICVYIYICIYIVDMHMYIYIYIYISIHIYNIYIYTYTHVHSLAVPYSTS